MHDKSQNWKESEVSPLLAEASRLYVEGKFAEAVAEASKHVDGPDGVVAQDARRLAGLSEFQLGDYAKAQEYWEKVTRESARPNDWFNLATSSTMNKDIELGGKAFDKALELYKTDAEGFSESAAMITYYYVHALIDAGEHGRAFERLNTLTHFYTHTGVTDFTHLVASAGEMIPSFEKFVEAARNIAPHIDKEVARKWFDGLRDKIDDQGKAAIDAAYR